MSFSLAVISAYAFGLFIAFILNIYFVFHQSRKTRRKQARDFIYVNIAFIPVVWGTSIYLERLFRTLRVTDYPQEAAHAIAVILPAFITFLIYKFFAFKDI